MFTYALSEVLVPHWKQLPEKWRRAFFQPEALSNRPAQENFLLTLTRRWTEIPRELRELFYEQTKHSDYNIRAAAGTAALIYHQSDPSEMQPVYMATLQDSEILVPLRVMQSGLGDDDHDHEFAEGLYARANQAAAAKMLAILTDRGEPKLPWKLDLAHRSKAKGGTFALGVLCYRCLTNQNRTEFMEYRLPDSPFGEPESVRLAWLWAYANSEGKRPALAISEIVSLLDGLSVRYRELALFNFSIQANYLPQDVRDYLEKLEATTGADANAIREGRKGRQPPGGSRSSYDFPVIEFI